MEAFEDVDFTPTPADIYETAMKRALMEKMANRFNELKAQGLSEEQAMRQTNDELGGSNPDLDE